MKSGIYGIYNIADGKWYIGQSVSVESRRRGHFSVLRNGCHRNKHLQYAFVKYGEKNFKFYILEEIMENLLDDREREWITYYKSNYRQFGYNLETGGNLNKHISDETRLKISRAHTGRPSNRKGCKLTDETRHKLSLINMGKPCSEETRKKLSEALRGRKKNPISEEVKNKISLANMGKRRSDEVKKKMSLAHAGIKRKPFSEEHKRKLGLIHKGKPWSEIRRINYNNRRVA